MSNPISMDLSLESDTFYQLKNDFDAVLNRTVGNMTMKSADEAVLTIKLKIGLTEEVIPNSVTREKFTKPTFKHEISSVMQVKDKVTGQLAGDYQLVWDEGEEKYVMRKVQDGQMNIFDDKVNVYAEDAEEVPTILIGESITSETSTDDANIALLSNASEAFDVDEEVESSVYDYGEPEDEEE